MEEKNLAPLGRVEWLSSAIMTDRSVRFLEIDPVATRKTAVALANMRLFHRVKNGANVVSEINSITKVADIALGIRAHDGVPILLDNLVDAIYNIFSGNFGALQFIGDLSEKYERSIFEEAVAVHETDTSQWFHPAIELIEVATPRYVDALAVIKSMDRAFSSEVTKPFPDAAHFSVAPHLEKLYAKLRMVIEAFSPIVFPEWVPAAIRTNKNLETYFHYLFDITPEQHAIWCAAVALTKESSIESEMLNFLNRASLYISRSKPLSVGMVKMKEFGNPEVATMMADPIRLYLDTTMDSYGFFSVKGGRMHVSFENFRRIWEGEGKDAAIKHITTPEEVK